MAVTTSLEGMKVVGRGASGRLRASVRAVGRSAIAAGGASLSVLLPFMVVVVTGGVTARIFETFEFFPFCVFVTVMTTGLLAVYQCSRHSAGWTRAQVRRWCGITVRAEYSPMPPLERDERGHWWTGFSYHRRHGVARVARFVHWSVRDATTRRDAIWWLLNPWSATFFLVPPVLMLGGGAVFALVSAVDGGLGSSHPLKSVMSLLLGVLVSVVGLLVTPYALRAHLDVAARVLEPGRWASNTQLKRRVEELTLTRADALGDQAAELRRIERDLHDGAQARLVAIGMTLGTIEHLMETDQAAARELLSEARQSSAKALQELRDLVRGIHPPVLAERGLGDAVRSLALDSPLPTEVTVCLPERPEPPVEAAVYFCISELLANAAKHSGARRVWVDILHRAGLLRVTVTDDGCGGAQPGRGSGLRGIERRLGTFDGTLSLSSPPGGPTTITMELPCALSSPRISTSSDKG
ncbi:MULTISPECIES: sensor histidine kinase [Kitasatospora]|uniref:histidine kinase n=1 Tax=Kitasatospora arboriphila TaxID=258052 RepID=A0ABN1U1Y1_9ACTN